ncbi:receptor-type tyrosine-protein phosphatase H [Trichomycterus rosablanca]|uniref:receptor-type tyrosine-protein phosphatase H n=1 Tax=Trichomycterus rosablanca TaxID=2290929 RepID=UPI002F3607EA
MSFERVILALASSFLVSCVGPTFKPSTTTFKPSTTTFKPSTTTFKPSTTITTTTAPTTPQPPHNVDGVFVETRHRTSLTLRWNKVNNSSAYNYSLGEIFISGAKAGVVVTCTVSPLTPGAEYDFILYTVFNGIKSSGYNFSEVTTPPNIDEVYVDKRNKTSLTLRWNKVNSSSAYNYSLGEIFISGAEAGVVVSHIVSSLTPGAEYDFILYTVFNGIKSSGYNFSEVTTPANVDKVYIETRTETSLTLRWNKVNDSSAYNYSLGEIFISGAEAGVVVSHIVSSLTPGTKYDFILYTVFNGIKSIGYNFSEVTTPSRVTKVSVQARSETSLTLEWQKINNSNDYDYRLGYNGMEVNINGSETDLIVNHTVSSLAPGTEYNFILYTVFNGIKSSGYNFSEVTTPSRVTKVSVQARSETSLTLEWQKINNSNDYDYRLGYNGMEVNINGSETDLIVNHTVSSLAPGTEYNFILYTVFNGIKSSGYNFSEVTTPSSVTNVSVKDRSETSLTLQWNKVNNSNDYGYILSHNQGNKSIDVSKKEDFVVTETVSNLTSGTKYDFTLYTVFKGVNSQGYNFYQVTTPLAVDRVLVQNQTETTLDLEWNKVNNNINYNYVLNYDKENININGSEGGSVVKRTVSNLTSGTKYIFTLHTVFEVVKSKANNFSGVTNPSKVEGLHCKYSSEGYALLLVWDPPVGKRTSVQVNISSKSYNQPDVRRMSIGGLMPAQWYTLTVTSLSGPLQSAPVLKTCQTDPRGVIAGILVFLLLAILVILIGVFIWRRKKGLPSVLHKPKSSETKECDEKHKPVSLSRFPEHFSSMNCDDKRGFREEYQDLSMVGKDQSCSVAVHPDNQRKNRFTNVLAYDSSRVKLSEQYGEGSDYINANYMPGYGGNSEQYIASQGPLPATVNDFWRMVWEQKSPAIVMLTRCIEGGRTKCEQYWPLDYTPCTYGSLHVTVQSEQKERSWTRREFLVRNMSTNKERTVTHFHFTAWPDHDVPKETDDIMEFRGIVREHIQSSSFTGPAVVHCSAGVGRTGTLIALDILLQQMNKEGSVSVYDCVHRMRLRRPLMVQTESQYVFLHQCIMDSLQPKEDPTPDPIYENSAIIYSNIMALQQYKTANPQV